MFSHIYMPITAIISCAYLQDQAKCAYIHVHLYINVLFPRYNAYCKQLFARCSCAALHQPEKELNPSPPPPAVDEPQFLLLINQSRARIFKLLRSPRIDSKEPIRQAL
jgi:hypothetical protein